MSGDGGPASDRDPPSPASSPEIALDSLAARLTRLEELNPGDKTFDPESGRERLRGWFAAALILLLFVVIALAFALFLLSPRPVGDLTDFLIIVVPPVTSLVSAVVGFYYGSSTRGRD